MNSDRRSQLQSHIAVLFEFPTLNGGERSMLACLERLKTQFRLTAIAPPSGDLANALRDLNIQIIGFEKSDGFDRLQQLVKELQPDLLHANSLSMSRLTGQLAAISGQPTSGHLRDIIRLKKKVIADLNANRRLIAVSQATKNFHADQGLDHSNCDVIYNGVDTNQFRRRGLLESRLSCLPSISADQFVVLSVGQICLRKRQLDLAVLVSEWPEPIHLAIAGTRHSTKPESIAYEQAITEQFRKTDRLAYLHLLGTRQDVPSLMNASDVLIHLAHQEPFGRTLLEAAASELPIIATDVGGTAEMLCHEQHALLVNSESLQQAASALSHVMRMPSEARSRATEARERICERFSIETAADNLGDFWRATLSRV